MNTFNSWRTLRDGLGFRADSTSFLLSLAREQGDVARFRLGGREAVLFAHPEAVTTVLVEKAGLFTKGKLMQRARRLLREGNSAEHEGEGCDSSAPENSHSLSPLRLTN